MAPRTRIVRLQNSRFRAMVRRSRSQKMRLFCSLTNRENRRIASLAVWPFGGAQLSSFWDGNSLKDDGTEAKPVFGCISLS